MAAKLSSVWTLVSLSALIVVSQCFAAPTAQREDGTKAAAADPPLVRSTHIHSHAHTQSLNCLDSVFTSRLKTLKRSFPDCSSLCELPGQRLMSFWTL